MFLNPEPNPHQNGRMTRAIYLEETPGQRFAIDAETLHKQPKLLEGMSRHASFRLKAMDYVAYLVCLLGALGTLWMAWWMVIPGLLACVMILATNRKAAGDMARQAALKSSDHFRGLHERGVLWLVKG